MDSRPVVPPNLGHARWDAGLGKFVPITSPYTWEDGVQVKVSGTNSLEFALSECRINLQSSSRIVLGLDLDYFFFEILAGQGTYIGPGDIAPQGFGSADISPFGSTIKYRLRGLRARTGARITITADQDALIQLGKGVISLSFTPGSRPAESLTIVATTTILAAVLENGGQTQFLPGGNSLRLSGE